MSHGDGPPVPPVPPAVPDAVIGPPDILLRARSEASRLTMVPRWTAAFTGSSPDSPLLVKRLDQADRYYYIVPFRVGERVTARLRMNAHTGKYSEGIGIDKSGDALEPYLTREQTHERIARLLAAEAKRKTKTKKKKKQQDLPATTIEPFLVWKACAQSFSAFLPFYLIKGPTSERYVRVDGKVYDTLTFGAGL